MYHVSDEYKEKIAEPSRHYYWSGSIVTKAGKEYEFQNDDIVKGSAYITRQYSGSSEIELGTVYSAELGISLFSDIDRYTLDDACITIHFHLQTADETVESVPMGVFYVAEANRHIKTVELKAYDCMLNLDKNFSHGLSSAYPYDFLTLLSKACHVELAQSKEEIEALPNGAELFGIYQENDIETWRDFLHYLAQVLGCFATIDRNGKLLLVRYTKQEIKVFDSRHRFSSSFSDFVTRYTAVSSTNKKTETAEYYAKKPDDGLTMNLGVNPLLQFGLDETRKRIINNILDAISEVEYVPFDTDTIGDPALDLGDVLQFTGGNADETKCAAITYINTKINGKQTIKCVGKNPKLAEAKSKNDKNITGLINSIGETKLSIYTFTNALALEMGEEKVSIINMEFASGDETNAEFHAEAIIDVSSIPLQRSLKAETTVELGESTDEDGNVMENTKVISFPLSWTEDGNTEVLIYYMLDGHEIEAFHPAETWKSGKHLLNLYYPIVDLEANQLHTFEVLIALKNGSAKVDAQNIISTITGQGLGVQERWDGRITANDTIPRITFTGMPTHTLKESVTTHFIAPKPSGLADTITSISLTGMPVHTLNETMSLFAPIVCDVVETTDRKKMVYLKKYVLDEEIFTLQKDYSITSNVQSDLDRGRMIKLVISTEEFQTLTDITILPLVTESFENKNIIYATKLEITSYMEMTEGNAKLKMAYVDRISGVDREIDRGRMAAFSLGFSNMETIEKLEVTDV